MNKLNPEKLKVEYRRGVTSTGPISCRKYTLTHSDATAELFLTVGLKYARDKITIMRDEVLAHWKKINGKYVLYVNLHVDSALGYAVSKFRYGIFKKELPLALEAIRYGDGPLFEVHPELDNSPILVCFNSKYPCLSTIEPWGTLKDYK